MDSLHAVLSTVDVVIDETYDLEPEKYTLSAFLGNIGVDDPSFSSTMSGKLSVKWAPEVYDPPATSLSHTIKKHHYKQHNHSYRHHTYHHCSKPKKHYHSNKHNKEKSKKNAHRSSRHSSSTNTRTSREFTACSLTGINQALLLKEPRAFTAPALSTY